MRSGIFRYNSRFSVHGYAYPGAGEAPSLAEVPENLRVYVESLWSRVDPESTVSAAVCDVSRCPYCGTSLAFLQTSRFLETRYGSGYYCASVPYTVGPAGFTGCATCGFWYIRDSGMGLAGEEHFEFVLATLRQLDVSDPLVGMAELGDHLARHVSDVQAISPRRFEELVADVYRQLGYDVQLTKSTRDGGYDVVLLGRSGCQSPVDHTIVECKRYGSHRRVGVGIVRHLLGVQLEIGARKAKIVASTHFSEPAARTAQRVNAGTSGYELELVDIQQLTEMLGVYANDGLNLENDSRFPATRRDAGLL